jgi:hypothetical protein
MRRKLTITIDPIVYEGLHNVIGARRISRFIEDLVRPHVLNSGFDRAYLDMSEDKDREDEFKPVETPFVVWLRERQYSPGDENRPPR